MRSRALAFTFSRNSYLRKFDLQKANGRNNRHATVAVINIGIIYGRRNIYVHSYTMLFSTSAYLCKAKMCSTRVGRIGKINGWMR